MRLCVLCLLPVLAVAAPAAGPAAPTVLIYASPYGPNQTFSRADRTWIKWVQEHSGGTLRIQAIWSGGLISSDQSLVELRHGVADVGLITPIYSHGGTHLIRTQTGFYGGAKTFEQQVAMYRCLAAAHAEYAREVEGLHILAVQGGTLPGLLTRSRAVRTLEDVRGMRLRVPTELLSVMRDLGADPVTMPMGEVYSSLAKGVLDGVVAPPDTLLSLHFGEVAKHYLQLEVPRGAYPGRAMGERRWRSLSPAQRAVLEASTPVWEAAMSSETGAAVQSGEAEGRRQKVEFLPIPAADQARFDVLYEQDGERNAVELGKLGIDGAAVFRQARRIARGIGEVGEVRCGGNGQGTERRNDDAAT